MPILKAYIQWEIIDDNGNGTASSYEHISDIDDAQAWVDHMENYVNGENGDDDDSDDE